MLKDFLGDQTGISEVGTENIPSTDKGVYTLDGRFIGNELPLQQGIYIVGGKKRVVK